MRIYAEVIHTVAGWNEYKFTMADCLNIITFNQEQYVNWKDNNIRGWAFERGTDPDSQITLQQLFDDY